MKNLTLISITVALTSAYLTGNIIENTRNTYQQLNQNLHTYRNEIPLNYQESRVPSYSKKPFKFSLATTDHITNEAVSNGLHPLSADNPLLRNGIIDNKLNSKYYKSSLEPSSRIYNDANINAFSHLQLDSSLINGPTTEQPLGLNPQLTQTNIAHNNIISDDLPSKGIQLSNPKPQDYIYTDNNITNMTYKPIKNANLTNITSIKMIEPSRAMNYKPGFIIGKKVHLKWDYILLSDINPSIQSSNQKPLNYSNSILNKTNGTNNTSPYIPSKLKIYAKRINSLTRTEIIYPIADEYPGHMKEIVWDTAIYQTQTKWPTLINAYDYFLYIEDISSISKDLAFGSNSTDLKVPIQPIIIPFFMYFTSVLSGERCQENCFMANLASCSDPLPKSIPFLFSLYSVYIFSTLIF